MGRNCSVLVLLIFIFSFFVFPGSQNVFADQTAVLRPTADGGEDSANWKNTGGTACNGASCYFEVDESSGASCANSDGDTTYIASSTNGVSQTFDLDESSIPDNATVTGIEVTVCYKWQGGGPTAPTFQTRVCIDGSCTNSGSTITGGASYQETTKSHTVNFKKIYSSRVEVGAVRTNDKNLRISQVSAVVTYTPSASSPSSGSGRDSSYAKIIFLGEVFPGAILGTYLVLEDIGPIPFTNEFAPERDGSFRQEILVPDAGKKIFMIIAKDSGGNLIRTKTFTLDLKNGVTTRRDNIILGPSVIIKETTPLKGEPLLISGWAAPGNEVELFIDDAKVATVELKSIDEFGTGTYEFSIDTGKLTLGNHRIQLRQLDMVKNVASDLSEIKIVKVSSSILVDFNKDKKINIQDWSVFLYNWSSQDSGIRQKDDLNNDSKVDIGDFSLFLASFQLLGS